MKINYPTIEQPVEAPKPATTAWVCNRRGNHVRRLNGHDLEADFYKGMWFVYVDGKDWQGAENVAAAKAACERIATRLGSAA
jgi:hypothetical protein